MDSVCVWEVTRMSCVCCVGLVCLVAVAVRAWKSANGKPAVHRQILARLIRAAGVVLWPLVLTLLVCDGDRGSSALTLAVLLNAAMWSLDAQLPDSCRRRDGDGTSVSSAFRMDATTLAGLGLSMNSLIGNHPTGAYTHLFVLSIVVCYLVVLPAHNLNPGCTIAAVVESVQKTVLLWCVCGIVAAIALTRRYTKACPGGANERQN